jgi:multidrug resistance protein
MEEAKEKIVARPSRIPLHRLVLDQERITRAVLNASYEGQGTGNDPYVVTWIDDDPGNPMVFAKWQKWAICMLQAIVTFVVALNSSAFSGMPSHNCIFCTSTKTPIGTIIQLVETFEVSTEVITLGISLFVLGFAIGPLIWAPLSELYGRQVVFIVSYGGFTAFNAGAAGAQNIQTLLLMRFFAGAFGSSPFTNAGGVIADVFPASERGLAMAIFALCPSLGLTVGPIVGGFLGQSQGWKWVEGLMAILSGLLWIVVSLTVPETYAPVLLHRRAAKLSQMTGKVYRTSIEIEAGSISLTKAFNAALSRPFLLLFREPIVFLLSIYMAIIYGTLYLLFGAYPIVYQQHRHWSEGTGGLAFLGVGIGMVLAIPFFGYLDKFYSKAMQLNGGKQPEPELRLPSAMVGAFAIPIGMFWFAWTNSPGVHWMASAAAGVPFGFGMVLVFLSITNYLVDAYTIFAASALAANAVLRSLFGAAFPLFTAQMFDRLGIHWASSIPAFLALACIPFPFVIYKHGPAIRRRCRYAAEAAEFRDRLVQKVVDSSEKEDEAGASNDVGASGVLQRVFTAPYDASPYDIDRVNTARSAMERVNTARSAMSMPRA